MCQFDVVLLPFLCSSTHQDHQLFAVLPEINPVTSAKMRYSYTPAPIPFAFEKLPCCIRTSAVVIFAPASSFNRSNQSAKELRPLRSRYSRISTVIMVPYMILTQHAVFAGPESLA